MTQSLLDIFSISCERGYRTLFSDLSFSLCNGEVLQLAGPNGSGKSTLIKCIAGISSDYEGEILWQGEPVKKVWHQFQQASCYLGHTKAVKRALTPRENLVWFSGLYPCRTDWSIDDALKRLGLSLFADTPCAQLSAGQQQRVALARLLISNANLWILDEPFTAIDKVGVKDVEVMISEFVASGGAVIITTHHTLRLSAPVSILELGC